MRFCLAIWTSLLLLVTPAFGGGSDGEACKHDGSKHAGEHKCKHKRTITFDYIWQISMSDEQLGKEKYKDSDKFIRKVSSGYTAGVYFEKKWEEYNLALYYNLSAAKASDGLLIATINAELPRSTIKQTLLVNFRFSGKGMCVIGRVPWMQYKTLRTRIVVLNLIRLCELFTHKSYQCMFLLLNGLLPCTDHKCIHTCVHS